MPEPLSQDIYTRLKAMTVGFDIRPGARLNEVALARDLGVSRTPLRESLNRLVAERLIDFKPGTGFICRELDPQAIYDLYELRCALECAAVRLACMRASDDALAAINADLHATGLNADGLTIAQATERDEAFHIAIARATGNAALVADLERINDRIRFIRWINMAARITASKAEHLAIANALLARDADRAEQVLRAHITQRMDQVVDAVKEGLSSIYMPGAKDFFSRIIKEA